jgi:hypothetical protein
MIRTYTDIEEVVVASVKIGQILGELGETPYEPMKEEQDEIISRKSTTNHQLQVLNETFINFFGKGIDGKARPSTTFSTTNNCCQLCDSKEHMASSFKFFKVYH